jgi:hypothetical protein
MPFVSRTRGRWNEDADDFRDSVSVPMTHSIRCKKETGRVRRNSIAAKDVTAVAVERALAN